ncbi:TPA: hypothetical protein DCZ46_02970 [Candidatus Campbellbacteria bacterium]|uniref:HTH arsR-type domain-containing protein n=2 Tax=Candidatus Campbelliibacteriota TaxID=1752727 RepID=A0A1F5ENN0_9BACT|nr:MAG: hypothetical protein UR58_C0001G0566 [Candidatus Campbellbacteria bacterium GW2011_OD1_34_28]KKP74911.1 MAG: Transcriptional regulator, MarR family [Candidatus Campbellbacteria bacterium GW2011_GWD2_35_24]KKP75797.1 MAG: MarR family transcriptional regulator [Candidatus Campbellbacteria bacterium GW2011_GWC2_35_28]KKP76955.1 MAG: hypothetical protein UR76_C0002G0156 [Candidatus Campbellbacteria bacterium GW2011_GWC1_35_31]KKP78881.1 MAG: Transcriptional regulator, MarR family [Candidatu
MKNMNGKGNDSGRSIFFQMERLFKGFSNHRRIEIIFLLDKKPELSVEEICEELKINFNTGSDHIRKLAQSGIIMKRLDKNSVRHALTKKGKSILVFCKTLV